jgi:hypothetical protein
MITVILGVAVCVSVLAKAMSATRAYRSSQNLGGFLTHAALSAGILGTGVSILLVPQVWYRLFERLVVGYAFFVSGGH